MKQTIKRVLAALLAAGLLVLCACSAKTAPAQEQEPEQTAAVETAPAEKPQEAASVEETPEKAEGEAQTPEEQPEAEKPVTRQYPPASSRILPGRTDKSRPPSSSSPAPANSQGASDWLQHTQSVCASQLLRNISRPPPASITVTSPRRSAGSVFFSFASVR